MSIDNVITDLENIIRECDTEELALGYFAALYLKVTRKVKEGIADGAFEDGARMERLDVVFARRYIDAYRAYRRGESTTQSWRDAFVAADDYWPIVLQHLLVGMNAHINLDLGIAAAEVMEGQEIQALHEDFNRINGILASLVNEVQEELAAIWPTLHRLLRLTKNFDDRLTDFSMEMARDDAWRFARAVAATPVGEERAAAITRRDGEVSRLARLVIRPGWLLTVALKIIRLGERGTVREKIGRLNRVSP